jgi:ribonuclease/clavin/mitogillin
MRAVTDLTIVNIGFRSTNFWVISRGRRRLMVDLGWPGLMGKLKANLERMDLPLEEIGHGLATHYHMDHAGLAQELKEAGMHLLVLPTQIEAIPQMKQWMKPSDHYTEISLEGNVNIAFEDSRALLTELGLDGEIIATPGHSDDSVSLVLDEGSAFTGDLTLPHMATLESAQLVRASWEHLRQLGARRVYPGHGPAQPLPLPASSQT